jgi:hypothetical protein
LRLIRRGLASCSAREGPRSAHAQPHIKAKRALAAVIAARPCDLQNEKFAPESSTSLGGASAHPRPGAWSQTSPGCRNRLDGQLYGSGPPSKPIVDTELDGRDCLLDVNARNRYGPPRERPPQCHAVGAKVIEIVLYLG